MSIVGAKIGVISLGVSCQTAYQIREHAELISSLVGSEPLQAKRMPFDWLICPPRSVTRMLDEKAFFPEELAALQLNGAPYWQRFNVYFWHDFSSGSGEYDVASGFHDTKDKYENLTGRFHDLSEVDRLVMVISNSQNNLDMVADRTRTIAVEVSAADIDALCDAADRFFARPCEYIVVTYDDRIEGSSTRDNVATYRIAKDASEWRGSREEWARVFADYFGKWPQGRRLPLSESPLTAPGGSGR